MSLEVKSAVRDRARVPVVDSADSASTALLNSKEVQMVKS